VKGKRQQDADPSLLRSEVQDPHAMHDEADLGFTVADAGTVRFKATGSAESFDARYRATTVMARLGYRF